VGFGHRRLAIIDLSDAGAQPMASRDGSTVLNYNGEIYNYIELRRELETVGHTFTSDSDSEVLLVAYQQWGLDCLGRLNGMFAFTIWDGRRDLLFCARDRFGEKPLFHASLPDGIAIASEMKALFAHPEIIPAPDYEMLDRFLVGAYAEDGEETLFRGV